MPPPPRFCTIRSQTEAPESACPPWEPALHSCLGPPDGLGLIARIAQWFTSELRCGLRRPTRAWLWLQLSYSQAV